MYVPKVLYYYCEVNLKYSSSIKILTEKNMRHPYYKHNTYVVEPCGLLNLCCLGRYFIQNASVIYKDMLAKTDANVKYLGH